MVEIPIVHHFLKCMAGQWSPEHHEGIYSTLILWDLSVQKAQNQIRDVRFIYIIKSEDPAQINIKACCVRLKENKSTRRRWNTQVQGCRCIFTTKDERRNICNVLYLFKSIYFRSPGSFFCQLFQSKTVLCSDLPRIRIHISSCCDWAVPHHPLIKGCMHVAPGGQQCGWWSPL